MNKKEIAKLIAEKIKDDLKLFKDPFNDTYVLLDIDMNPVINIIDNENKLKFVIKIQDVLN